MWVVALPQQVVDGDVAERPQREVLVDQAHVHAARANSWLGGRAALRRTARSPRSPRAACRGRPCRPARAMYGIQPAPPSDRITLRPREPLEHPAHQPVDAGHHRVQAVERDQHGGRRVVRRRHQARRAADVHAHRDPRLRRRLAQSGSQWSVWTDGRPSTVGFSENAIALRALGDDAVELGDRRVDVVQRQDRPRRTDRDGAVAHHSSSR